MGFHGLDRLRLFVVVGGRDNCDCSWSGINTLIADVKCECGFGGHCVEIAVCVGCDLV